MFKNFRPIGNRILVKREVLSELKTDSGLVITVDPVAGEMPPIGTVVAVSIYCLKHEHGGVIPAEVHVGDKVYWAKYADVILDDEYSVMKEQDVLGILE